MLLTAIPIALLISIDSQTTFPTWLARTVIIGTAALAAFGLAESKPARLPRWLGRSAFQLLAIGVAVPIATYAAYWITVGGNPAFVANPKRALGFVQLTLGGIIFGVSIAMGALRRQRDARVHAQLLAYERERRELERQAIEARTQLLRSQIQPHFLFNTLANIQALVEAGSPHAPQVLASLIAYLKAAVPQLDETASTLGREVELARAYLELMRMRMPDRLRFALDVDPSVLSFRCPPTTLLTLVENAVRHGIDPAEDGGDIDVAIKRDGGDVLIRVDDSGVGPGAADAGTGTGTGSGLKALRERLALAFGEAAALRLFERQPHGFRAEVQFPAEAGDNVNMQRPPTALIADDEPMLREALARLLAELWPELRVVAQARNGREAIAAFEQHGPDVCFLDVQMPGLSGVEAARAIGHRAHLVFVTAFEQYAVEAFARGALDYLVKPVERDRLRETVERLEERLRTVQPPPAATDELIRELASPACGSPARHAAAVAARRQRPGDAADSGGGDRLPARGREVHAGGLARRRRPARRGAGAHAVEGTRRPAGPGAVRAGAPLGHREPRLGQPCHARPQRNRDHPSEGPARNAAGEPRLRASVPADVGAAGRRKNQASFHVRPRA